VVLACAVMMLFMDSWLVPLIFLSSIGLAILYNLGTNYFMGEISFITKALSAVLQLAVTMDYSIFLWHSYCEEKSRRSDHKEAMAYAINNTLRSVAGSSLTTVAGFLSLCFMTYMLGFNLGIVMAKGVLLGVIGCVTLLPAMILLLDKPLEKTMHKALMPRFDRLAGFIVKRSWAFLIVFALLIAPAVYGYSHTQTYYELSKSLPDDMSYAIANTKLSEDFDIATTHMALVSADLSQKDTTKMIDEMNAVDGVRQTIGLDSLIGPDVPEDILPDSLKNVLESDDYKLLLINSEYKVASDAVNNQVDALNAILKSYDQNAMLIGEAPVTKDMISITGHDFDVVTAISIVAVFIIIAFTLRSISLPVILVAVIEFAIFINLGMPYYTGTSLPFITPICISTIQLGSTVDYAILMTTRFVKERALGCEKHQAVSIAVSTSMPSIIVSAFGFFAATFGVALYSNIDMISSMCKLMARGAVISMLSVIFILPALFILLDKVICKTTFLYGMHRTSSARPAKLEES
jgi:predicted RND superfamily exporter protein